MVREMYGLSHPVLLAITALAAVLVGRCATSGAYTHTRIQAYAGTHARIHAYTHTHARILA